MRLKILPIVLLLLFSGCVEKSYVFPDRAIVDKAVMEEAIQTQRTTDARSILTVPEETPWFEVIEGPTPIILTAPHATPSLRKGERRPSDGGGTAALAKALNKLTGATVLYTTYASPSDPNFEDDNAFKEMLEKMIEKHQAVLVIDIHGSHAYRPYDVDLGTMYGKSLLGNEAVAARLIETLRAEGIRNISYNYFSASQNETITKFAAARGIPAIQMEINKTWLVPSQDDLAAHRFAQLLQAMAKYITAEKSESPDLLIRGLR